MGRIILTLLSLTFCIVSINGYTYPNCDNDKQVIVHLFEWKWEDIARECEDFLGPAGFCGVQVSPPHENIVKVEYYGRPWWERYQPVSYKIISRSGDENQFRDMVQRCRNVGVNIYADVLANHMAGTGQSGYGTGGSYFDSDKLDFPGVPYSHNDFTPFEMCGSTTGIDYMNINQVRNCYLSGLTDLWGSQTYVQDRLAEYMNHLLSLGVAGFRMDASKHMWPDDLVALQNKIYNLNTEFGFQEGSRPVFFHEVIDQGSEPIKVQEYYHLGKVTEFRYCIQIANGIKDFSQLGNLYYNGMADWEHAFIFVDNHDNQRGHGGGGQILTHSMDLDYKLGAAFTLAQDYGFTRLMSSYRFGSNTEVGPPMNGDQSTKSVIIDSQNKYCVNDNTDWVCEHRWDAIFRMVQFRNAVVGTGQRFHDCYGSFCAISRGNKGFFAMARGGIQRFSPSGMPAGTYQDIMTGNSATVNGDGTVEVIIADDDVPVFAICQGCQYLDLTGGAPPPGTTTTTTAGPTIPPISGGLHRTVIFFAKETMNGQDLFIRGGIGEGGKSIDITMNSLGAGTHYDKYEAWSVGDTQLDWNGEETSQGMYNSIPASGTPLAWTTNDPTSSGYQELNIYGDHYWMVDFDMDCSQTTNGWFELKGYLQGNWEIDVTQGTCSGSAGAPSPMISRNHVAKCGHINVFEHGNGNCIIDIL